MDLRRPRIGEWITGVAGASLLVSLFLPWYRSNLEPGAQTASQPKKLSAWEAFTVVDLLLATAAAMGVALLVITAVQRTAPVSIALAALTALVGTIALGLFLFRLASAPGGEGTERELGLAVGGAAVLAVAGGAWLSMRDERPRRSPADARRGSGPRVELVSPPPASAGSGSGSQ